jgi:hypothetical protein
MAGACAFFLWTLAGVVGANAPGVTLALPALVDTELKPPSGRTLTVVAGGDLQAALNNAQPGDVIALEAGATFSGNFTLPRKGGSDWITVRTSAPEGSLPNPGTRVTLAHATTMPKVVSPNGVPPVSAAPGAHHYRFIGIEVTVAPGVKTIYSLFAFGGDQSSLEETPHHLIVDRCYVHGQPATNTFRGVLLNSTYSAVIDSHISEIHVSGFDSQAILGFNGPGPFKIQNNYLEASGENIMFGGADPRIKDLVPSDIEIRRNHLFKPLSWKIGHPTFAGTAWTVKNLLELKSARRVLVDGNLLENSWPHAQTGFAVLFTVRNQSGGAPWSVVEDVTFTNNRVRNVGGGLSMHGFDHPNKSKQTKRVLVRNNLWEGVGGNFAVVGGPVDGFVLDHNTVFPVGNAALLAHGAPSPNVVVTNNLMGFGKFGIAGDGIGGGRPAIARYFPEGRVERNVLVGPGEGRNFAIAGNSAEVKLENVGMVAPAEGDYRLGPGSRYQGAGTDGKDIGVDFAALVEAMGKAGGPGPAGPPLR